MSTSSIQQSKPIQRHARRSTDRGSVNKSRFMIARLYVAISILISVFSVLIEPVAVHSKAVTPIMLPMALFYSAVFVCVLALLDTFINDILPNKYHFKQAFAYRHLIYMSLALISFSLSAGLLITYGGSIFVGKLWLDSFVAVAVAILDIFARHRKNSWR